MDGVIEPDRDEWRDMWSTVRSDGRDPEQLGLLERAPSLVPVGDLAFFVEEFVVARSVPRAARDQAFGGSL